MRGHATVRQDERGTNPIVIFIVIVVITILLVAGFYVLLINLPSEQRDMICGSKLGPANWLRILLNTDNPLETTLDPLDPWEEPIIPDDVEAIVFRIMYEGAIAGEAELYSLYPELAVPFLVVSVALYIACELSDDEAKSYADATSDGLKLALLIGLEAKKGDDRFYPSFSIELDFSKSSGEYSYADMSLEKGAEPDLAGLVAGDFPLTLRDMVGVKMIAIVPTH